MPFMRGRGALRRTKEYLEKGEILLNEDIQVILFGYNPNIKRHPHHTGLTCVMISIFATSHMQDLDFDIN
jgi:hypothetical protein